MDKHVTRHHEAMADAVGEMDTHADSMHQRMLRAVASVTGPMQAELDALKARLDALEHAGKKPASK